MTEPFGKTAGPELRETHSGMVMLLGDLAYKIKKPIDLGFLDFRTPAARERVCRRELDLNRRLAPDVYLDVATFTRSGDVPAEPVLVMRRMPEDRRLATLIRLDADVDDELRSIARQLAAFHSAAVRSPAISMAAGPSGLWHRWTDNLNESAPFVGTVLDAELFAEIRTSALRFVDGRTALLGERAEAGFAVDGHGDLITEDVFCLPDGPRILDCLEFDDALRWVDVLDDIAFLAMDIEWLGHPDLATAFTDWYIEFSGTAPVDSLRHHYIAYRAFVRAKVSCIRAAQGDADAASDADSYARLALRHLRAGEVRLVLVGGAPGTGKSTVARGIADALGAVQLSSDTVRRELDQPAAVRYSPDSKAATYTALFDRAEYLLAHGESVVLDATWADSASRHHAAGVAAATASGFVAFECQTPADIAADRAERRLLTGTAESEAGSVLARVLADLREPWPDAIGIDTSGHPDAAIRVAVASCLPDRARQ